MRIYFQSGEQSKLIKRAIAKAGSERKLARLLNISRSSISHFKREIRTIPESLAESLFEYAEYRKDNLHYQRLPSNWGQILGGKNAVNLKRISGKMEETIRKLRGSSSIRMKEWHKVMKDKEPEKYFTTQYERFKKIGNRPLIALNNGIKVRNKLEKEIGEFLFHKFPETEYELYLNIDGKAYFPDFKFKNIIIEVTAWKNPTETRLKYLNKKMRDYRDAGYKACLYIPQQYRKFYITIDCTMISTINEIKEFIMAS